VSFGAGHALDMIKRISGNRTLLTSNHAVFKESLKECIEQYQYRNTDPLKFKTVPKEELERMKNEIRARAILSKRRQLVAFCISVILSTFCFIWLMNKYY
jgi:hypothetical protein